MSGPEEGKTIAAPVLENDLGKFWPGDGSCSED